MFRVNLEGQTKGHLTDTPLHVRVKKTLCGKATFYRFPPGEWDGRTTNMCQRCLKAAS